MFDVIFSTHRCYTTSTERNIEIDKKKNSAHTDFVTRSAFDMTSKANHVVDDNAVRIKVDDHARKMNRLQTVVNIPK